MEMAAHERNECVCLLLCGPQSDEQFPPEAGIIAWLELLHAAQKVRTDIGSVVCNPVNVR
jgi:hypothetical protein